MKRRIGKRAGPYGPRGKIGFADSGHHHFHMVVPGTDVKAKCGAVIVDVADPTPARIGNTKPCVNCWPNGLK